MSIPVYLLRSAPISKETPNGGKNYAQLHSNQKGPKGQKDAERGDTPNKTAPPSRTPQSLHNRGSNNNSLHLDLDFIFLLAAFQLFGRKEVWRSFSFSLLAMWPFLGWKRQWCHSFHYQIAVPVFCVFLSPFFLSFDGLELLWCSQLSINIMHSKNYLLSFVNLFSIRDFQIIFIGFKEKGNNVQFKYWTWEEWSITQLNQYMKCKTL